MGRALESVGTKYIYPENFSCLIEDNTFESNGYYNNTISEGMGYIEWSANAIVRNNTFYNTTGNELDAPACWLRGGCATYEVEGNTFNGNLDITGDNANRYAPLKINIGANVNADTTKTYAPNTCNYGSDVGKYAEIVRSTPKQPDYISGDTGYLGLVGGLVYRMHEVCIDYSRKVTIAPGATCYMKDDITIESTGKLIARGTNDKPIHFVGTNGYFPEYIRVNAGWTKDNYADSSAETVFENCTFDKKITILASLVETDGEVPEELPVTLYMKDCQMNDVERGIEVKINGKKQTPSVILTDSDSNALIENTDYIVKMPDGMKDVGSYKIEVVLNGSRYSGNAELSFQIAPKGTNITRLRAAKKSAVIKWKKRMSQTDGYQIRYSVDNRFKKGNKLVTVNKGNKNSKKLMGLQAKKKYYITIRTYNSWKTKILLGME